MTNTFSKKSLDCPLHGMFCIKISCMASMFPHTASLFSSSEMVYKGSSETLSPLLFLSRVLDTESLSLSHGSGTVNRMELQSGAQLGRSGGDFREMPSRTAVPRSYSCFEFSGPSCTVDIACSCS